MSNCLEKKRKRKGGGKGSLIAVPQNQLCKKGEGGGCSFPTNWATLTAKKMTKYAKDFYTFFRENLYGTSLIWARLRRWAKNGEKNKEKLLCSLHPRELGSQFLAGTNKGAFLAELEEGEN